MLSTPGVGSGLDISGIIEQLMTLERRPLIELGAEQIELEAQLSGIGSLKSAVSALSTALADLADADNFRFNRAVVADEDILTATASAEAGRGTYAIAVNRVAENHRLASGSVFADADTTQIGVAGDTITIGVGSDQFTVDIGEKTLNGIRDAINAAADNTGVVASLLQDDLGYRLTLTADETGSDNFVTVAYSGADVFSLSSLNADRDGNLSFEAADLDAELLLENSFTVTRSRNQFSDVIDGVSLDLKQAGTTTIDLSRDDPRIQASVQQFVDAYNAAFSTLDGLRSEVLSSERASLNSLESQLRRVLSAPAGDSPSFSYLFELGVTTRLDGTLELDSSQFLKSLNADPAAVADLFTNTESGLAVTLKSLADRLTEPGGLLDGREQSLNAQIRDAESDRTRIEFRLAQKEQSLLDQFSALDALIAGLTTTSSFLTTQLDQIAAVTRSSNDG